MVGAGKASGDVNTGMEELADCSLLYGLMRRGTACLIKMQVNDVLITSEREARSEFLLIYTKNLSMSGRPAVVTLFRGLYLWNHKPD